MEQTVIIGFSKPRKWKPFAALIIWWDQTYEGSTIEMSHSYTRFIGRAWERDFIYQAAGHKTHFMGSILFETINQVVEEYEIPVSKEAEAELGKVCVDREGKPYAVKQVAGQILINLARIVSLNRIRMSNPWADGEESVSCIEEMGWLLADHCKVEPPKNLETISVWEFRNWVASLPGAQLRRSNGV